jgi:hypothetical protein
MNTAEDTEIHKAIAANAFFHDFLLFLEEARRDPFRLTERGNLRLGDIHYLSEHFHLNIIRRYIYGENGGVHPIGKECPFAEAYTPACMPHGAHGNGEQQTQTPLIAKRQGISGNPVCPSAV